MGRYLAPLHQNIPQTDGCAQRKNGMKHRFPRMTRVAIPALPAIATAACTVGPDFVRPQAAHSSAYGKSVPSAESATSVTYGGQVAEDWV